MRVSVVSRIDATYVLPDGRSGIKGNVIEVQHCLAGSDFLHLILTEGSASAELPHYDLVHLLATECKIERANHRLLLYTTLTHSNFKIISSFFQEQNVEVKGLILGEIKKSTIKSYRNQTDSTLRQLR